ncbi:MAG: GNAT family N-acetyltransferase [Anaerobacillus sp.]
MKVRNAKGGDEDGIASLLFDMGYPSSSTGVKERFRLIMNDSEYVTLLVEENDCLIGMLGMHFERSYVSDITVARIITMVTSRDHRQRGVGRMLIMEAERLAVNREASTIVLNSGNRKERAAAHLFYKACGFIAKSTGFYKSMS